MTDEKMEDIYYTLTGQLIPEAEVQGMGNAFAEGAACARLLEEIYDARDRILDRLEVDEEDDDLECILRGYECMQRLLCLEMFRLGRRWAATEEAR